VRHCRALFSELLGANGDRAGTETETRNVERLR